MAVLEETGYMSRVVFWWTAVCVNTASAESRLSVNFWTACAIPAVMAAKYWIGRAFDHHTRYLYNLFSSTSRVFNSYLIGDTRGNFWHGLSRLTLMGLYWWVGTAYSLLQFEKTLKIQSKTYFVIEMPNHKLPLLKNVGLTVFEKTKSFVVEAGKSSWPFRLLWIMHLLALEKTLIMEELSPSKGQNNSSAKKNSTPLLHPTS